MGCIINDLPLKVNMDMDKWMERNKSLYKITIGCSVLIIVLMLSIWQGVSYNNTIEFESCRLKDPSFYVLGKCKAYDVVLLGTRHKQRRILEFIARILPHLSDAGVSHLGLEISSDQQASIEYYLENGKGIDEIILHYSIDCPDYRFLFEIIRNLEQENRPEIVALDLPPSFYNSNHNRDEWMARSVCNVFEKKPDARILVVVGNLHAIKNILWEEHITNKNDVIRGYLSRFKPDLHIFSICQCICDKPDMYDLMVSVNILQIIQIRL